MSSSTEVVEATPHAGCEMCGFRLWTVLAGLDVSTVGLYDDRRFPGRLILSLDDHYEHLEDVPSTLAQRFLADVQYASRVVRKVTGADRINVAVLGNQEPHVHAHLIPRRALHEPHPTRSPWDDPRPRGVLPEPDRARLIGELSAEFC